MTTQHFSPSAVTAPAHTQPARTFARHARRVLRVLGYVLAVAIPPTVLWFSMAGNAYTSLTRQTDMPLPEPALVSPVHDPAKPTVVLVASNAGTEITDLLAPYAVFAAADAFNVYVVAPQRGFTPLLWGGVDIMPHYSFAEIEALLGRKPDVIVIPFIKNPTDPTIVEWIRRQAGPDTTLLSICGGAHVLAATGLADGLQVTTHNGYFPILERDYPQLKLVRGVRYTDNGHVITSAGITSGVDASLYTLQKLAGRSVALEAAARLNYPHTRFLDDPAFVVPAEGLQTMTNLLNAGLYLGRKQVGVVIADGVGEIELAALLDTYGRSFTAFTHTVAAERAVIRSQHGMYLVPRYGYADAPRFDRLWVAGDAGALTPALAQWIAERGQPNAEVFYPSGTRPYAFDITLSDLARVSSRTDALSSALGLEYPLDAAKLQGSFWPVTRLAPGIAALLAGGALALGMDRLFKRRRQPRLA